MENIKDEINDKLSKLDVSGALELIQNLLQTRQNDTELLHIRADIYYKTNNFHLAIDDLTTILEISPEDTIAHQKISLIKDVMFMIKTDIFESTNLYEPPNSMFSDGNITFR